MTRAARLAPAALALLLPAALLAPTLHGVTVPLPEAALAVVTVACAAALVVRRGRPSLGAGGAALALVGVGIAAGAPAGADSVKRLHMALLWLGLGAAFALCTRLDRRGVALLLGALAVSGLVEASLALAEYAGGHRGRTATSSGAVVADRPEGTLQHPNALALFLLLTLLPVFPFALRGPRPARAAAGAAAVVGVAAVAVTYSRTAWLALAVIAVVLAARAGGRALTATAGGLAALVLALALTDSPFRARLAATADWSRLDPGGFRITLWGRALHDVAAHPLTGAGIFHEVASFDGVPTLATHPHELWLGLAALYGLPVALAFAAVAWIGVRDAVLAAGRPGPVGIAATGIAASLGALLLTGLADYPFWNETLVVTTVLVLGAGVALRRVDEPVPAPVPSLPAHARPRRLAVVVAAWNAGGDLRSCLRSIARHGGVEPADVVVVDNGSTDGSVDAALEALPGAVVVRNARNTGVAHARNQGIAATDARYVLILDADAQLTPGAVDTLCRRLDEDPRLALVGPRLEYPDGAVQSSPRAVPRVRALVFGRPPVSRMLGGHWTVREHLLADWSHDRASDVDYVLGACQLVRADALAEVGLYDEGIFYGPEDADLCLRLHERGWRVLYEPTARVVHRYRRLTVRAPFSRQARALAVSWPRILLRHRQRAVRRRVPA